jgi:hypothetical protein
MLDATFHVFSLCRRTVNLQFEKMVSPGAVIEPLDRRKNGTCISG